MTLLGFSRNIYIVQPLAEKVSLFSTYNIWLSALQELFRDLQFVVLAALRNVLVRVEKC